MRWPAGVSEGELRPVYWQGYQHGAAWIHEPTGTELGSIWSTDNPNDIRLVRACRPVWDPDRGVLPQHDKAEFTTIDEAKKWVEAYKSSPA